MPSRRASVVAAQAMPDIAAVATQCTCLNLRRITRKVTQRYDEWLAPSGLRATQFSLLGILRTTQAVLPHMRTQRHGRIVNVSSVLGFLPAPYMGLYSASKHAVEGLSETLDHEVRQFGIRVSLVEPSYTRTNLEANSPRASSKIADYDRERDIASRSVANSVNGAPEPDGVANAIVEAALGAWRLALGACVVLRPDRHLS